MTHEAVQAKLKILGVFIVERGGSPPRWAAVPSLPPCRASLDARLRALYPCTPPPSDMNTPAWVPLVYVPQDLFDECSVDGLEFV